MPRKRIKQACVTHNLCLLREPIEKLRHTAQHNALCSPLMSLLASYQNTNREGNYMESYLFTSSDSELCSILHRFPCSNAESSKMSVNVF